MKFLKKINIGLVAVASVLYLLIIVMYLVEQRLALPFMVCLHVAVILTIIYFLINGVAILKNFSRKVVRETTSVILLVPILVGVFSMIYLIADGHKKRFDLTVSQKFSLSPQTIKILDALDQNVHFLCFFKPGQAGRAIVKAALEQYRYWSKKISYEFIDPDASPRTTQEYGIEEYGEIVLKAGDRHEKIKGAKTEEEITNALIKVISQEAKVIYFVTGHGEPSIEGAAREDYGLLKNQLVGENYTVKELQLMRASEIPQDAACVVLASPKTDLFDEEMDVLREYVLRRGGKVLVLADVELPKTVRELLAEWGVVVGENMIIDQMSQLFGANHEVAIIGQYADHPIMAGFNVAAFFPTASSVTLESELPDDFTGEELAFTGPGSWAEADLTMLNEEQKVEFGEGDIQGPVSVAVVLTKKIEDQGAQAAESRSGDIKGGATADNTGESATEGDAGEAKKVEPIENMSKIVVYGDADFVSNARLRLSGNKDLFFNTIAWLSGDEKLIAIRPHEVDATPLYLNTGQSRMLFIIPVVLMPLLFIVSGVIVVYVKRSKRK